MLSCCFNSSSIRNFPRSEWNNCAECDKRARFECLLCLRYGDRHLVCSEVCLITNRKRGEVKCKRPEGAEPREYVTVLEFLERQFLNSNPILANLNSNQVRALWIDLYNHLCKKLGFSNKLNHTLRISFSNQGWLPP